MRLTEEKRQLLADEDRGFLLALLAAPPKPNAELKKAASSTVVASRDGIVALLATAILQKDIKRR